MIARVMKFLVFVIVIGGLGLTGYAYLGDLAPEPSEQSLTVTLDAS